MTAYVSKALLDRNTDLRSLTDELRAQHDVVNNQAGEWVLLRHADVKAAALDHTRFSSQVSRFLQVPNGLDGAEHSRFREVIERHLSHQALSPFLPVFEKLAAELISALPRGTELNAVSDIGAVFAVRAQCAWLGWPAELEPKLLQWMRDNHSATRSQDRAKMAQVAQNFDEIILSIIRPRRQSKQTSQKQIDANDVTNRICREQIDGRELSEAELVSILRNWTGGDLGSIALCVGVIVAYLVQHPEHARALLTATDSELETTLDEILRLDNPFVSNRRVTTCPVTIGKHQLPAGARVQLNWTSANRDAAVFGDEVFSPHAHAADNVVYGIGKHVCPGRLLATWQLRIVIRVLLANTSRIALAPNQSLERERPPLGGYHSVPVVLS
ncbi:MAG TPA: cytochrome P450 [Gammaproteobacteria bacterium]|nr:cytochrome P450 [Gammaproteobacteria bacterium]